MNALLFIIVFLYVANWGRLKIFSDLLTKPKHPLRKFEDKNFTEKLNKKVGIEFNIKVQESPELFGYMGGIPIKPIMVLSKGMISAMTKSELEWVVLHEAGHCVRWHVVKEAISQIVLLAFGALIVSVFNVSILVVPFYALLLGIFWYQVERRFELEADTFSLDRIDDPRGMITANQKMKKVTKSIFYRTTFLTKFFTPHLTYDDRIEMANLKLDSK